MLFDCGEGTQQQMMRAKTGMMKLSSIFITHLHADHILGIPGLIQTMSFHGREDPLLIHGPEKSREHIVSLTRVGYTRPRFEVRVTELSPGDVVRRDGYDVLAVGTEHNIPSIGYALVEHERTGRFNRERAIELGVSPGPLFSRLQRGESVTVEGGVVHPVDVLGSPRPGRRVVYTGDTRPTSDPRRRPPDPRRQSHARSRRMGTRDDAFHRKRGCAPRKGGGCAGTDTDAHQFQIFGPLADPRGRYCGIRPCACRKGLSGD